MKQFMASNPSCPNLSYLFTFFLSLYIFLIFLHLSYPFTSFLSFYIFLIFLHLPYLFTSFLSNFIFLVFLHRSYLFTSFLSFHIFFIFFQSCPIFLPLYCTSLFRLLHLPAISPANNLSATLYNYKQFFPIFS